MFISWGPNYNADLVFKGAQLDAGPEFSTSVIFFIKCCKHTSVFMLVFVLHYKLMLKVTNKPDFCTFVFSAWWKTYSHAVVILLQSERK